MEGSSDVLREHLRRGSLPAVREARLGEMKRHRRQNSAADKRRRVSTSTGIDRACVFASCSLIHLGHALSVTAVVVVGCLPNCQVEFRSHDRVLHDLTSLDMQKSVD